MIGVRKTPCEAHLRRFGACPKVLVLAHFCEESLPQALNQVLIFLVSQQIRATAQNWT